MSTDEKRAEQSEHFKCLPTEVLRASGQAPEEAGECQFAVEEKKEQEHTAGIGVCILQKRSIGTVSDISVSIHIDIFDNISSVLSKFLEC